MTNWQNLNTSGPTSDQRYQERLREEEEKKRRQEEVARQQQQQQEQQAKAKEEKRARTQFNPIQQIKEVVRPATQAVQGAIQEGSERIAEMTGESREDFRKRQAAGQQRLQSIDETMRANQGPGAEAVRVVAGAVPKIAEGVIDTSVLLFDTLATGARAVTGQKPDPRSNPFSAEYVAANTDFGLQGPKTAVGQFSQGLLTFGLTGIAAARRLPQAALGLGTGGAGLKGAIASGIVPGAIAD
jgi:hypothetical protein